MWSNFIKKKKFYHFSTHGLRIAEKDKALPLESKQRKRTITSNEIQVNSLYSSPPKFSRNLWKWLTIEVFCSPILTYLEGMHGLFRLQRCSWICLTPFVRFAKHQPVVVTSMSLSSLSMLSCGQILAMPQPFSHEVQCTQCTQETKQTTLSRRKR